MGAIGAPGRIATCHTYRVAHELHKEADACTFACYERLERTSNTDLGNKRKIFDGKSVRRVSAPPLLKVIAFSSCEAEYAACANTKKK